MSALGQQINNLATKTQQNFNQGFSQFSNTRYVSGTRDFLNSNSLVAKFAFLILVVIIFILCLRISFGFLNWIFAPSQNPRLLKGMLNAQQDGPRSFSSNPNKSGSIPILRSNNENQGVEFTWSIWIYISDLVYQVGKDKHIFHKGSPITSDNQWHSALTQSPGLWIDRNTNTLRIRLDIYGAGEDEVTQNESSNEKAFEDIEIPSIPLNKWINVMIRVQGKIVDVFINGAIVKRHILQQVVRQNYGDTYILQKGGFSGKISDLSYFSHALNVSEILSIVNRGPDLTAIGDDGPDTFPPYFALRWYFSDDFKKK